MSTTDFGQRVVKAIEQACKASEWVMSRAQEEAALQPIVNDLLTMDKASAESYIRIGYMQGSYCALAVAMYKAQR